MDKGLLSDPRFLAASRDFVCARIITYQDAEESAFIKSLSATATGGVLNTAFALLAPDGKTVISGTGRSPGQVARRENQANEDFAEVDLVLAEMQRVRAPYTPKDAVGAPEVPYLANFRVALNVASCDNQPLVVVLTQSDAAQQRVDRYLAPLAWDPSLRGRFAFVSTREAKEMGVIEDAPEGDAVFVVQPDTFGLKGHVLAQTGTLKGEELRETLRLGLARYTLLEKGRGMVREARRLGLSWEENLTDRADDPNNRRRARARDNE